MGFEFVCCDALHQRMAYCYSPRLPYFVGIVYHELSRFRRRLSETGSTALAAMRFQVPSEGLECPERARFRNTLGTAGYSGAVWPITRSRSVTIPRGLRSWSTTMARETSNRTSSRTAYRDAISTGRVNTGLDMIS